LYALQRGILLRRENPTYRYWVLVAAAMWFKMVLRPTTAAMHGFTMVLFIASRGNNFVGGTCALPSARSTERPSNFCFILGVTTAH